jgi:hypothetical protein
MSSMVRGGGIRIPRPTPADSLRDNPDQSRQNEPDPSSARQPGIAALPGRQSGPPGDWGSQKHRLKSPERHKAELNALTELEDLGVTLTYEKDEDRIIFRDRAWEIGLNKGFYKGMDLNLIKLADQLRSEPYDQGEIFP